MAKTRPKTKTRSTSNKRPTTKTRASSTIRQNKINVKRNKTYDKDKG